MSANPIISFLSPVGRYVQGDFFTPNDKDQQGNTKVYGSGPKKGQPKAEYFAAIAFAKNDPAWPAFKQLLDTSSMQLWPQLFPNGQSINPMFSNKVIDGDGIDTTGKPNNQKAGYAGHWVVRMSTTYPPKVFPLGQHTPDKQITQSSLLPCGYYVRVGGTIGSNQNPSRPGIILNPSFVEICAFGDIIQRGPDAAKVLGSAPAPVLPAGARPIMGAPGVAHGGLNAAVSAPQIPAPAGMPQPTASPGNGYGVVPGMPAQLPPQNGIPNGAPNPSYTGYMAPPAAAPAPAANPAMQQPIPTAMNMAPPPLPPQAPAPASPVMTPKAGGMPYAEFIKAGWTDDALRGQGYIY